MKYWEQFCMDRYKMLTVTARRLAETGNCFDTSCSVCPLQNYKSPDGWNCCGPEGLDTEARNMYRMNILNQELKV